jgi:hypothetical protein
MLIRSSYSTRLENEIKSQALFIDSPVILLNTIIYLIFLEILIIIKFLNYLIVVIK